MRRISTYIALGLVASMYTGCLFAQSYLKLTWDAAASPYVTSYQILKGMTPDSLVLTDSITHPTSVYFDYDVDYETPYYYQIQAVNSEGDVSEPTPVRSGIIHHTNLSVEPEGLYSLRVSWQTDNLAQSQVVFGARFPPDQYSERTDTYSTQHSAVMDFLIGGTTYYLSCLAFDSQGNLVATQDTTVMLENIEQSSRVRVIAYPNPYRQTDHDAIYFDGLQQGSQIYLFDLTGELVWNSDPVATSRYAWNVQNRLNEYVSSGVYIYKIESHDGSDTLGKVVVIR